MKKTFASTRRLLLGAVVAVSLAANARAGTVMVDMKTMGNGSELAELVWLPSAELKEGSGAIYDTTKAGSGMFIYTPVAVDNTIQGYQASGSGSNFLNVTIHLVDVKPPPGPAGNATVTIPFTGMNLYAQPLQGGSFELLASDKQTILLAGHFDQASILVPVYGGMTQTGFIQASVTYDDGAIYDSWIKTYFGGVSQNITDTLNWNIGGVSQLSKGTNERLLPFTADMTGLFYAPVPEPAAISLLGSAAMLLVLRRRRNK